MGVAKNALEIFSVLDKSNCRKCGEKTCMAFAGAVYVEKRRIHECPKVQPEVVARFAEESVSQGSLEEHQEDSLAALIEVVVNLDFPLTAERIGARMNGSMLTLPILGKNFGIRQNGTFSTDLHLIPWLVAPTLDYVLNCKGARVSGDWISFREIAGGKEKYALFKKRGEDVFRQLADMYTDFFDDIVHMFSGKTVAKQFEADVAVVLYPFPLVPMMICYWKPEEDLGSSLNLYFDKSIGENLGVDSAFFLGTGLARMIQKLAEQHAW